MATQETRLTPPQTAASFSRWLIPVAAVAIHICIGSVYAWSTFNRPIHAVFPNDPWWFSPPYTTFSTAIILLGLSAAFANRWLDDSLSALLDILIAFPTLLLAMLVIAAQGASLGSAIVAIGLAMSAVVARLTRILTKRVLAQDYITASRTSGTSWLGVIGAHILPNIWPTVSVNLALQFGLAVLAEASLSYLGLGAPPPNASWGRMLQEAQGTVYTSPLGAILPGILLVMLVLGVNLIADGLRDVGDPTQRSRG